MAAKTTSLLYFCFKLLHDFWFRHDFELFFDQNGYRQNTNKSVFMHVNYNIINNICNVNLKNRLGNTAD